MTLLFHSCCCVYWGLLVTCTVAVDLFMVLILYCASQYIIHSCFCQILGLLGILLHNNIQLQYSVFYLSRKFIHFLSIDLDFLQLPACITLLFHSSCTCMYSAPATITVAVSIFIIPILSCASKYVIHSYFRSASGSARHLLHNNIQLPLSQLTVAGSSSAFSSIDLDFLQFPTCITLLFHSCCTQCTRLQYLYRCSQKSLCIPILYCAFPST